MGRPEEGGCRRLDAGILHPRGNPSDYDSSRALREQRIVCCDGFIVGAGPHCAILLHGSARTIGQTFPSANAKHPGARIKMSAQRLRQQSLRPGTDSVLLRCVGDGGLIGHAFATRWDVGESKVCWVTQLCVRRSHRRLGIATEVSHLDHLWKAAVFGLYDVRRCLCIFTQLHLAIPDLGRQTFVKSVTETS